MISAAPMSPLAVTSAAATPAILQWQRDGHRVLASWMDGPTRVDAPPFSRPDLLETWSRRFLELMEKALAFPLNDHRPVLEEFGACLFDNLLGGDVGALLREQPARPLLVDMPESLLGVPIELMFDGQEFLCTRFALGRRITAWDAKRPATKPPAPDKKPTFLLIAGHADDESFFDVTRREIYDLCAELDAAGHFQLRELLVDNRLDRADLLRALTGADYVHFSGHSDGGATQDGREDPMASHVGWLFEQHRLGPRDIADLRGCDPSFVFSNSCRSGATGDWRDARDMVRAFWQRGARHYIGAHSRIHFKLSADLAREFYRHFLKGETIGESLRLARVAMATQAGQPRPNAGWLSYVLYGDPSFRLTASANPAFQPLPPAKREPRTVEIHSGLVRCGWSGKMIPPGTAMRCCEPGCLELLGSDAQLDQRRMALDMILHNGGKIAEVGRPAAQVFCRQHLPDAQKAWLEKSQKALRASADQSARCAWTGRTASRSELLSGQFEQTPEGYCSPEARKRFTCSVTGKLISAVQARDDMGFMRRDGKVFSEDGWWKTLGCSASPRMTIEQAKRWEAQAREGLKKRLTALTSVDVDGVRYAVQAVRGPLRDDPDRYELAITLKGGRLIKSEVNVGIVRMLVTHGAAMERLGADRQPATVQDRDGVKLSAGPMPHCAATLVLAASPTGWTPDAEDQSRAAKVDGAIIVLQHLGNPAIPLLGPKGQPWFEALKLTLAGIGAG